MATETVTETVTETGRDKRAAKSGKKRCVVSREMVDSAELIRFVLSPKRAIIPDVAGKLPGRGAWVKADAALVWHAYEKKIITKALKGGRPDTAAIENLDTLMADRCQHLLGLGRKSGGVIGGGGKIKAMGTVSGLIIANDASQREAQKLRNTTVHDWVSTALTSAELGQVFGRQSLAFAAVVLGNTRLNSMLKGELHRLHCWRSKTN